MLLLKAAGVSYPVNQYYLGTHSRLETHAVGRLRRIILNFSNCDFRIPFGSCTSLQAEHTSRRWQWLRNYIYSHNITMLIFHTPTLQLTAAVSPSALLLVAVTTACLLWALWWRQSPATAPRLDLPLVDFDGVDNLDENALKERYTKETGDLLKTGYNKVYRYLH